MKIKYTGPSVRNSFQFIILIIILLNLNPQTGCKEEINSPPEKPSFTTELKGKVILENQTEHSNALVYLDSLNRGVATDSNGLYSVQFSDEDTVYDGTFKIYFFVNEYEMDSAQYVLVNGKVKLDSLDIDSEGNLPTKELEQLLLIEGWTDKQEYRIGDTIEFTARFNNVTDRTVHVFIYSIFNQLGYVSLYNENYPSFILSPCDPVTADLDIFIPPVTGFYEGRVVYTIRDGSYCGDFRPLLLNEYIVSADLFIESRFRSPYDKFERFIRNEWYKLHRGISPKLDNFPNKYKYPQIKIIE